MKFAQVQPALDWGDISLVVFDVDGTLYDQRGLRLCMLREMIGHATGNRQVRFISILRAYRRIREEVGDSLCEDFERELLRRTATSVGCSEELVRATAEEWLEQRPLRHLLRYRYPRLPELFRSLRERGKKIGIYSDYPADRKVAALGLFADATVWAGDDGVGVLKPNPRGLILLMERMAALPSKTIVIGDRPERDGLAAQAAGVRALIRSSRALAGWRTFARYDDPLFALADRVRSG